MARTLLSLTFIRNLVFFVFYYGFVFFFSK